MAMAFNKASEVKQNLKLTGRPISPGLAKGKAFIYQDILQRDHELYDISDHEVDEEYARIEQAVKVVCQDLEKTADRVEKELEKDLADIFQIQKAILNDPSLLEEIKKEIINELVNGEQVVKRVFRRWERKFRKMSDDNFRQRGDDVADIGRKLLRELTGIHAHILEDMPNDSILVAKRLLPSDTVFLSRKTTLGALTEFGGAGSHAALLTREMGIPAVAGIKELWTYISSGDMLLLDGFTGDVIVNPDERTEKTFDNKIKKQVISYKKELEHCCEPARTLDGVTIQVMANVGCLEDLKHAIEKGADGVGLYRIEQLYLSRKNPLSEKEILEIIGESLEPLKDKPATIRLLDAGGDKELPFLDMPYEQNPFLGRRGVRLLLDYQELVITQLRALLRLSKDFNVEIMVPMVTIPKEMLLIRNIMNNEAADLGIKKLPPLGAMIETPAAALCSKEIAEHSDFLSIGTNDLTQYTMAAGRENPLVSDYFVDDHPAVQKMLHLIIQEIGKTPVAVCGELAGNPDAVSMLLKIGIKILSVAPPLVPKIKEEIKHISLK